MRELIEWAQMSTGDRVFMIGAGVLIIGVFLVMLYWLLEAALDQSELERRNKEDP